MYVKFSEFPPFPAWNAGAEIEHFTLPHVVIRDCHRYGKTRGFEVMGLASMGTVVDFGTLQHTVYPY